MRRGTPSAELFGKLIYVVRTAKNKTMRDISSVIECPAATISLVERAQRTLKEPKLELWARALDVDVDDLLELWWLTQGWISTQDGSRTFYKNLDDLFERIVGVMERLVPGTPWEIPIPQIEPEMPIVRNRTKSLGVMQLKELVDCLTGSERERVRGYVQAILENREE